MDLKQIDREGVTVIQVAGKLMGGPDATQLHELLHNLIDKGIKNFVLDLEGVDWVNSSGLGILISGLTTVRNSGGELYLANLGERLNNILNITKLSSVFTAYDNLDEAVNNLKQLHT